MIESFNSGRKFTFDFLLPTKNQVLTDINQKNDWNLWLRIRLFTEEITESRSLTVTHTNTHSQKLSDRQGQTGRLTQTHPQTHSATHTHRHTATEMVTHTQTHRQTHTHSNPHMYTDRLSDPHTHSLKLSLKPISTNWLEPKTNMMKVIVFK